MYEDFNFENYILIDGLVYECKEVAFTFVLAYRNWTSDVMCIFVM